MIDQDRTRRAEVTPAPPSAPAADHEAAPPIATQPVSTVPGSPAAPGRSRLRWLVALVVTVLVVGAAGVGTFLLTREAGAPEVLSWAPVDSVMYAELRLDLPGSQEAELAKAMSAFPGFDDQAAFPSKLSEALDQLVHRASGDKVGYKSDIEPWFGGQLSVSVGPLPASPDAKAARGLLLASVTDGTKAADWAARMLSTAGATTATETYGGVTITTITPPASSRAGKADVGGAYAVLGPVIALGDPASVRAAIDTHGTAGLATNAQFQAASASVSGDRLGFVYVDAAAIAKGAQGLAGDAVPSAMPALPSFMTDLAAPWTAVSIRARDGAFVIDTRAPHVEQLGPASTAGSALPSLLPPTTVALVEGHDVGQAIERVNSLAATDPQLADGVKQLDDSLRLLGGFGAVVDWMGEGGIAVTRSGDALAGGLVVTPTDRAAASRLFTEIRGLLALGGSSAGIKVSDEAYGDATITVVDTGSLPVTLGGAVGGSPVSRLPSGLRIAYSVTDQVVVIGSDADFVKAVLDARTGDNLAKSQRFSSALARVDAKHGSLMWLDVAGLRDLAEARMPAADRADYEANVKPYLAAVDAVIGTSTPGSDVDRGTIVVIVNRP